MPDRKVPSRREAILAVAAAIASRSRDDLEAALRVAVQAASIEEVDEIILQTHLFVGFPDALNALALWREVRSAPAASAQAPEDARARGEEVCRRVYGANFERLRENVSALHPDLEAWMLEHGYGRVIGRTGLSLVDRELCTAALLAVWGAPRQLHSHLRGALNVGATAAEVEEAIEVACRYLDMEQTEDVRALWSRIRAPATAGTGRG